MTYTVQEHPALTQFSTNNLISVLYFNIYFKPYIENLMFYICKLVLIMGLDSSVGIANRYGLDGTDFESRLGRDFPHLSRPVMGPTQPPIQWELGLSQG
jgi:hypothetical protein